MTVIPHSLAFRSNSQQFFDAAAIIFRSVDQRGQQELDIAIYAQNWSALLLEHVHNEVSLMPMCYTQLIRRSTSVAMTLIG